MSKILKCAVKLTSRYGNWTADGEGNTGPVRDVINITLGQGLSGPS